MKDLSLDHGFYQKAKNNKRCFGDVFIHKNVKEQNRSIFVMSDGMGSGIKANILATLTSSMIMNFIKENKNMNRYSEVVMKMLPVCRERKIAYSTFVSFDIQYTNVSAICYESPEPVIFEGSHKIDAEWSENHVCTEWGKRKIGYLDYQASEGTRIIYFSDGVTQSGIGNRRNAGRGWPIDRICEYIKSLIKEYPDISSSDLSAKIIHKAELNDSLMPKDDISCGVLRFRNNRILNIFSGPPSSTTADHGFAEKFERSEGMRIICGGTTADIIKRELGLKEPEPMKIIDNDLPPVSFLEGAELVTEGSMTLNRTIEILENNNNNVNKGAAAMLAKLIKKSDIIRFFIGTSQNIHHIDLNIESREKLIERMLKLLEEKYLKKSELYLF